MVPDVNAQSPFPACLGENDPITSTQSPVGLLYQGAAAAGNTQQHNHHPNNSIGAADPWAFQGVDMAFFDSLMRETSNVNVNIEPRACSTDATNDCSTSPVTVNSVNSVNNVSNTPGANRTGSLWMSTTSGPHGVQSTQRPPFMGSRMG